MAPAATPPGSDRWVLAGDPPTVTGSNFRELVTQNHDREIFVSEDSMIRVDYLSGKGIFRLGLGFWEALCVEFS